MAVTQDRLFSPRFFLMCGFSFTVFLSAFQMFPTAPFHIRDLGGSTFASGLFMACLTYSSAITAPLTGALADKVGLRRTLVISGVAITAFSIGYAVVRDHRMMLALTLLHGLFWSGLLTASGAYMSNILPPSRRAEGIGYWGFASVSAVVIAPSLGFWIYQHGWVALCAVTGALNFTMAVIAWRLPPERLTPREDRGQPPRSLVEWRVMALSVTLLLYSYSYGGITSFSAMYAEAVGVTPKAIYLTVLALGILATRPISGALADRVGYVRVLIPCLGLITVGLLILQFGTTRIWHIASAATFGAGYGSAYPIFAAYVLHRVDDRGRGAAFGAIIAAFDTGIGTGSLMTGWLIQHYGFQTAFGVGAAVSALAIPYFAVVRRILPASPTAG
ncbi:MAG: MFS transporter [Acidobacteriota bacterium]